MPKLILKAKFESGSSCLSFIRWNQVRPTRVQIGFNGFPLAPAHRVQIIPPLRQQPLRIRSSQIEAEVAHRLARCTVSGLRVGANEFALYVGPGTQCSPRDMKSFSSIHEGQRCGGMVADLASMSYERSPQPVFLQIVTTEVVLSPKSPNALKAQKCRSYTAYL